MELDYQELREAILSLEDEAFTRDDVENLLSQYTFDSKYIRFNILQRRQYFIDVLDIGSIQFSYYDIYKTFLYIIIPLDKGSSKKIHAPKNINSIKYFLDYCVAYWHKKIIKTKKELRKENLKRFING